MWKIAFSLVGMAVIIIAIIGYFVLRRVRERKQRKGGKKLVFHSRE